MKNRWITMILVLSLAMNTAVLTVAGYHYFDRNRRPSATTLHSSERDYHFYEKLGLTPAQLEKIAPMANTFHRSLKGLHSDMEAKKSAMINLLSGENVSPAKIEEIRKEMATIQDSIQKIVIAHVLNVKEVLNSNQSKRFFELLNKSMHQEPGILIRAGEQ
jgi:Spy/CpxP family protein refolding chaperone